MDPLDPERSNCGEVTHGMRTAVGFLAAEGYQPRGARSGKGSSVL